MADFDFPPDLLQLQRAFFAAEARCEEISAALPRAVDIADGLAEISDEQRAERDRAWAEQVRLAEALQMHGWWDSVADRLTAKDELRRAARA